MEFEWLSRKMEWEAQRIIAAFEVTEWKVVDCNEWETAFNGKIGSLEIVWVVDIETEAYSLVSVGDGDRSLSFESTLRSCSPPREELQWYPGQHLLGYPAHETEWYELMVRGLFRLGFDDEFILAKLPPLSAHEKLELRLSMPREFWPQKWLDEE